MRDPVLPQVDSQKCVGYGLCSDTAPQYFKLTDEGISRFNESVTNIPAEDRAAVTAAVHGCPAGAIEWVSTKEDRLSGPDDGSE
jgi:ferredoxin